MNFVQQDFFLLFVFFKRSFSLTLVSCLHPKTQFFFWQIQNIPCVLRMISIGVYRSETGDMESVHTKSSFFFL